MVSQPGCSDGCHLAVLVSNPRAWKTGLGRRARILDLTLALGAL